MNSNDEIYKIKYLKYKQKYLDLKIKKVNIKGGAAGSAAGSGAAGENSNSNIDLFRPFADEEHVKSFIKSDFNTEYNAHNNITELNKDIKKLNETMKIRTEQGLDNNDMILALIRLQKFAIKKYDENLLNFQGILQNLGYKPK